MPLSCYSASLLCAAALGVAEVAGALGAHPALLATARALLLYVWARCWSARPAGGRGGQSLGCSAGRDVVAGEAAAAANGPAGSDGAARRTWRSAGAKLPEPSEAMNLIKSRRSVFCKDMTPGRPLDPAALRLLLEAASWAPSHGRTEPAHFVVFESPQSLAALAELSIALIRRAKGPDAAAVAEEEFAPGKRWANAACLIAICMRRRPRCCTPGSQPRWNPEWEEVAAVACAVQNMHLMATALPGGVCGYWSSWYESVRDAPEMYRLLGLSEGDRCLGFFVVGQCERVGEFRSSRGPASAEWR